MDLVQGFTHDFAADASHKELFAERLNPVEFHGDLDNNGQLTGADSVLVEAAFAAGADEEEIDKGTEFIFTNDKLSNGAGRYWINTYVGFKSDKPRP